MQVLNNGFNFSFAPLTMTLNSFTLWVAQVIFGVGIIKLYNVVPPMVYWIFPGVKLSNFGMEVSVTRMSARCHQTNARILESWKAKYGRNGNVTVSRSTKWARAFVKSCYPLKVYIGQITSIGRNSVLTTINFTFQWTITALLALQFE